MDVSNWSSSVDQHHLVDQQHKTKYLFKYLLNIITYLQSLKMKFFTAVLVVAPVLASAININGQFEPMNDQFQIDGSRWYTKFVNKRNTEATDRQGYENEEAPKEVDLHKGEFCVDVSTYGPVKYDKKPVKVCDSTFVKNCEDRSEQVS